MAKSARALTELESCALAIIWQRGPCSAYVVRKVFASSSSPEWSASAGSVYPVITRLEQLGLISGRLRSRGTSRMRELTVTSEGARVVKTWVGQPSEDMAAAPPDPIRTRAFFLEALGSRSAQLDFVSQAERHTRAHLSRLLQKEAEEDPDSVEGLASRGAVHALRGRLAWLRGVRTALNSRR